MTTRAQQCEHLIDMVHKYPGEFCICEFCICEGCGSILRGNDKRDCPLCKGYRVIHGDDAVVAQVRRLMLVPQSVPEYD